MDSNTYSFGDRIDSGDREETEIRIIDPLELGQKHLPLFVLVDNLRGFFPWLIKLHTQGDYSHIAIMTRTRFFASQDLTFKEVPIENYLKPHYQLKFWQFKHMPVEIKAKIFKAVAEDLNAPWYKRRYDFLGLLGQLLRIPWLNNPWRTYCSERIAKYLRLAGLNIFPHPTPSDIDAYFKTHPQMQVLGYYFIE